MNIKKKTYATCVFHATAYKIDFSESLRTLYKQTNYLNLEKPNHKKLKIKNKIITKLILQEI